MNIKEARRQIAYDGLPERAKRAFDLGWQMRSECGDVAKQGPFRVGVAGPDDIHDFECELEALRHANEINKASRDYALANPNEDLVLMLATVETLDAPPNA